MPRRKLKDWEVGTDGPVPVCSSRCSNLRKVRIIDEDGQHFGWEGPGGEIILGALVAPSATKQAELDAINIEMQQQITAANARVTALDALRAKREAGAALDDSDLEGLADIILGRL